VFLFRVRDRREEEEEETAARMMQSIVAPSGSKVNTASWSVQNASASVFLVLGLRDHAMRYKVRFNTDARTQRERERKKMIFFLFSCLSLSSNFVHMNSL
jgi:hypothetical protein